MSLQAFTLGFFCIVAGAAILWGAGGILLGCGVGLVCLSIWTLAL